MKARSKIYRNMEQKIRAYYESLIIREQIDNRLEHLTRQRQELQEFCCGYPETVAEDDYGKAREQLLGINSQILMYTGNRRFLENEHALMEYAVRNLSERDRLIIELRYHKKKSYIAIGHELFLTDSRICQIRGEILLKLHHITSASSYSKFFTV